MNKPDWKEIHNKKALENPQYVAGMHPNNGPTKIVERLAEIINPRSTVFEFGVWPGKNIVYLSEKGFEVQGQDVSDEMIRIFQENISGRINPVDITCCPAQEYLPDRSYDAFVCTHVLHFMPREDATGVIRTMQEYTNPGGYNALAFFDQESPTACRPDRFHPNREEILSLYPDWEICREASWKGSSAVGLDSSNIAFLLRKPKIAHSIT